MHKLLLGAFQITKTSQVHCLGMMQNVDLLLIDHHYDKIVLRAGQKFGKPFRFT